jgi:hypothetical protein
VVSQSNVPGIDSDRAQGRPSSFSADVDGDAGAQQLRLLHLTQVAAAEFSRADETRLNWPFLSTEMPVVIRLLHLGKSWTPIATGRMQPEVVKIQFGPKPFPDIWED